MKSIFHAAAIVFALVIGITVSTFAQTEREKGIEFFKKGNYAEAVRLLEQASNQKIYKKDGEIWNYLGLAYIGREQPKNGRKAFEKAVKFTPQNSTYHTNLAYAHLLERKLEKARSEIQKAITLDPKNAAAYYIRGVSNLWESKNDRAITDAELAISLNPKYTASYVLHSDALLAGFGEQWMNDEENPHGDFGMLTRAADSLKNCLANCPRNDALKTVVERADAIRAFTGYFQRKAAKNAPPDDPAQNKTPLNVTYKPKPSYTDYARREGETGTIRVAVFFGADGKTKYALVLKGLRYGLTEQALLAARNIAFEPEKIDGKPVSVVKVVVFNFSIY